MHIRSTALALLAALTLYCTALPVSQPKDPKPIIDFPSLSPKSAPFSTHFLSLHTAREVSVTSWIPGWTLYFSDLQMLLPGLPQVADLAAFYSAVEAFATTAGAKLPYTTDPNTEIAVGSLRLHVACSVAHVPWSFVREFAQMLREMTAKGFTGFYDARLINVAAGVTVYVTLHVGQIAAAA
ncbi:MAG: hypothetical protein Q9195_006517 [Heterodermia aff. obscurata]